MKQFFAFCALCVIGISAVCAQPLPDKNALRGFVTDEARNPLPHAWVRVSMPKTKGSDNRGQEIMTDAAGRFAMTPVDGTVYSVSARAPGYVAGGPPPFTFLLEHEVHIVLRLQATIPMRFLAADGTPVANREISARFIMIEGHGGSIASATTDATGTALFKKINPGTARIDIKTSGRGYATIKSFTSRSGLNPLLEVLLQPSGALRIRAWEQNADGTAKRGIGGVDAELIHIGDRDPNGWKSATASFMAMSGRLGDSTSDIDGTTEYLDLPPGRYRVEAKSVLKQQQETREVEIEVGKTTQLDWIFAPFHATSLQIEVRDRNGKPVPSTEFRLTTTRDAQANEPIHIGDPSWRRRIRTDAAGRATLYPFAPGLWRFWLGNRQIQNMAVPPEGALLVATQP